MKLRLNDELVDIDLSTADVAEIRPGVFSVLVDGKSYTIHETGMGLIACNGVEWTRVVSDPRDRRANGGSAESGAREIKAAMPGKVVRVLAEPGQSMEAGQGLLILEAMKMQNEVRCPRSGVISAIRVNGGDTVISGQLLVTLE